MLKEHCISALNKAFLKRKSYLDRNHIQAFRLIHHGELDAPLVIDIYQNNAVIHLFDVVDELYREALESALSDFLPFRGFFYKKRTKKNIALPQSLHAEIIIQEYGNSFLINLSDYLDTGLFLDHRETRRWVMEQSKGKVVLNTFAYTGSFSVYAAAGGAEKTYSVDLSKTYCEWIKKNLALNNLSHEKNWVYKMDTFEFFRYALRKNITFDIIIIDPPTFSKNKGENFSVERDHPKLIKAALDILHPRGFIIFSNNYVDFSLKEKALPQCRIEEKYNLIPQDFPRIPPHRCFVIYKN